MISKNILFNVLIIFIALILLSLSSRVHSAPVVKVGVYECPPFVIKNDDNTYSGLSILLWQQIAKELELEYTLEGHTLKGLLEGVRDEKVDIGVSCLSITPEREKFLDFSHSFYETHLAIVVQKQGYLSFIKNILTNKNLLIFLAVICGSACIIGGLYYLLEHKVNDKLYSMSSRPRKLVEGFLLGLLFITKGPFNYYEFKTLTGRALTVLLAVATTFFIASFTAVLASSFTLGQLSTDIKSPYDLLSKQVGVISGSTSSELASRYNVIPQLYDTVDELLAALDKGDVDAIIADNAILKYTLIKSRQKGHYSDLTILPYQFSKQNYGFALKDNSPYEELLNQSLLQARMSLEWRQALNKFLAEEHF